MCDWIYPKRRFIVDNRFRFIGAFKVGILASAIRTRKLIAFLAIMI